MHARVVYNVQYMHEYRASSCTLYKYALNHTYKYKYEYMQTCSQQNSINSLFDPQDTFYGSVTFDMV